MLKYGGKAVVVEALTVFLILNFVDWYVTAYALKHQYAKEANPIANWIYGKLGVVGLYSYKQILTGVIILFAYLSIPLSFEAVIWLYNTIFALIVAWNSFMVYLRKRQSPWV